MQPEPDGTGGAIRAALPLIEESETVLVLSGDVPLISAETIAGLLDGPRRLRRRRDDADDRARRPRLLRPRRPRPRRARSSAWSRPKPPATPIAEQLAIREINAGTYAFDAAPLAAALAGLSNDNAQGEYYLPDVFPALREAGHSVAAHLADDLAVTMGVNNRVDLAAVEAEARRRILEAHMLAGVTVVDPGSTWVDADVEIAADARIEPGTSLRGATEVGAGSVVGPLTTLIDTALGEGVAVPHSYLVECEVLDGCTVGPFAYLRPGAVLEAGAKAGTFVEIKNSHIGEGAKVPHLAYVGDADVGAGQQPRRRHDHRQLRRIPQEPDRDRRQRPHRR